MNVSDKSIRQIIQGAIPTYNQFRKTAFIRKNTNVLWKETHPLTKLFRRTQNEHF
jgi:hypothetical protein